MQIKLLFSMVDKSVEFDLNFVKGSFFQMVHSLHYSEVLCCLQDF